MDNGEEQMIGELGSEIGFGRVMQLAQKAWRRYAEREKLIGSELMIGPCAAFTVPRPHPEPDTNGHCDWCCGSGWVTERVLRAMAKESVG